MTKKDKEVFAQYIAEKINSTEGMTSHDVSVLMAFASMMSIIGDMGKKRRMERGAAVKIIADVVPMDATKVVQSLVKLEENGFLCSDALFLRLNNYIDSLV